MDRPSYQVRAGDVVTVRGKSQKAVTAMAESVDTGQAMQAVQERDIQKGYESVDKQKAAESVDSKKAMEALMK